MSNTLRLHVIKFTVLNFGCLNFSPCMWLSDIIAKLVSILLMPISGNKKAGCQGYHFDERYR